MQASAITHNANSTDLSQLGRLLVLLLSLEGLILAVLAGSKLGQVSTSTNNKAVTALSIANH